MGHLYKINELLTEYGFKNRDLARIMGIAPCDLEKTLGRANDYQCADIVRQIEEYNFHLLQEQKKIKKQNSN